ncbi:MAG: hypothetical protein IPO17_04280 [Flavobacteriales bacterium]|nr:hypothetical protein [Flavobacteriales bacterium]
MDRKRRNRAFGYHIDKTNANGSPPGMNTTTITGTTFQNAGVPFVAGAQYMGRAIVADHPER